MVTPYVQTRSGRIEFELPSSSRLLTFAEFGDHPDREPAVQSTEKALENPVQSARLEERLTSEDTVAILIEDLTRTSPKKTLLELLLQRLERIGIPPENIRIVIALGTHRALSQEELEDGYGREVVARYTFINHDCRAEDLVEIGRLPTGCPVKVNPTVHQADFRIGIGSIFPHPLNGFGGGCKILFPGVADVESILEHHLKYSFVGQAYLGNMRGNEFHLLVDEMARPGKLDFVINSVLDHDDRLYRVVCGDPVEAHLEGVEICRAIVCKSFKGKSDLTVISSFPYSEGPQIMKPLAPAAMITRKNGVIVLVADYSVAIPEIYFETCEKFRASHSANLSEAILGYFAANRPVIEQAPPELNMSIAQVLLALNDFKVILVCKDLPERSVEQLGFFYADNVPRAIELSENWITEPAVNVVPSGGVILPIVG